MWWSGASPKQPGSSSSSDEGELVEIPSEADDSVSMSSEQTMDEEDDDFDVARLKANLEEQETLLDQLRGVVRSNEAKLEQKEKAYASRLSRLQSRATRMLPSTSTPEGASATGEASSVRQSRLNQLKHEFAAARSREQAEQRRVKELELMVKELKSEVEERDDIINRMRTDDTSSMASSFVQTGAFIDDDEKNVASPDQRSPLSRSPPLGASYDSSVSAHAMGFHLSTSEVESKNEKILELQEKNIELERKIFDLEETIKARDQLVQSRTEAVGLMSADLNAKGLSALEETRMEMRAMHKRFTEQERALKEANANLKIEQENTKKRLQIAENDLREVERTRFDLSSCSARLQEKVVRLQEQNERQQSAHLESGGEMAELVKTIEMCGRNMESEKVDTASIQLTHSQVHILQSGLNKLCCESLSSSLSEETSLKMEEEKLALLQAVASLEQELSAKNAIITDSLVQIEDFRKKSSSHELDAQNLKSQLEALEEEVEKSAVLQESEDGKPPLQEPQSALKRLRAENESLKTQLAVLSKRQDEDEKTLVLKSEKLAEKESELVEIEKLLLNKNNEIGELLNKIESFKMSNQDSEEERLRLQEKVDERERTIAELNGRLDQLQSNERLKALEEENQQLAHRVVALSSELETQSQEYTRRMNELQTKETTSNDIYLQASKNLDEKTKENEKIIEELEKERSKLIQVEEALEEKTTEIERLVKELRNVTVERDELLPLSKELDEMRNELERLNNELGCVKHERDALHVLSEQMQNKENDMSEIQRLQNELCSKVALVEQLQERLDQVSKDRDEIRRKYEQTLADCQQDQDFRNEETENKVMELELKLAETSKELLEAKEALNQANANVEEVKRSLVSSLEQQAQSQESHASAKQQFENNIDTKVKELKNLKEEISALREQQRNALNSKTELELSFEASKRDLESAKERLSDVEALQVKTMNQLSESVEAFEENEKKLEKLAVQLEETEAKLVKEQMLHKTTQENYKILLENVENISEKSLIEERDKLKTKCDLLTDKAKKLIVKCKQLEAKFKEKENVEDRNIEEKSRVLRLQCEMSEQKISSLEKEVDSKSQLLAELKERSEDNLKAVTLDKDTTIQDLQQRLTESEDILSEYKERSVSQEALLTQTLEEVSSLKLKLEETQDEVKRREEDEDNFDTLENELADVKEERNKLQEDHIHLKNELEVVILERSQLKESLERVKRELKNVREGNLMNQMMNSPLLLPPTASSASMAFTEAESVQVEVGSEGEAEQSGWGEADLVDVDENEELLQTSTSQEVLKVKREESVDGFQEELQNLRSEHDKLKDEYEELKSELQSALLERSQLKEAMARLKRAQEGNLMSRMMNTPMRLPPTASTVSMALTEAESVQVEVGSQQLEEEQSGWGDADLADVDETEEPLTEASDMKNKSEEGVEALQDELQNLKFEYDKLQVEHVELKSELQTAVVERSQLKEALDRLKRELKNVRDGNLMGHIMNNPMRLPPTASSVSMALTEAESIQVEVGSQHLDEEQSGIDAELEDLDEKAEQTFQGFEEESNMEEAMEEEQRGWEDAQLGGQSQGGDAGEGGSEGWGAEDEIADEDLDTNRTPPYSKEMEDEALKDEISRLRDELSELKAALSEAQSEKEQKSNALASAELSLSSHAEQFKVSEQIIEDLKKRIDVLTNEQKSLQLELFTSYQEVEDLKFTQREDDLKEARSQLAEMEERIEELKTEAEMTKLHLASTLESKNQVQQHCDDLQSQVDHLSEVEKESASLRHELVALKTFVEALQDQKADLERELKEREREARALRTQVSWLNQGGHRDEDSTIEFGMKEHDHNMRRSELEMEILELEKRLHSTQEELETCKADFAAKFQEGSNEPTKLMEQIRELERNHAALLEENERLKKAIEEDSLQDDENEVEAHLQQQNAELIMDELKMEVSELQERLSTTEELLAMTKEALKAEMSTDLASKNLMEASSYQTENLVAELEKELEKKQNQCESLSSKMNALNEKLQEFKTKIDELTRENNALKQSLDSQNDREDDDEVESHLREQSDQLNRDELQMEVVELQARLRSTEEELRQTQETLESERKSEATSVHMREANAYQTENLVTQLEKELEKKQGQCEDLRGNIALLNKRLKEYEATVAQLRVENESLRQSIDEDSRQDEENEVESRLKEQSEQITIEELKMEVSELQARLKTSEDELILAKQSLSEEMKSEATSQQWMEASAYQAENLVTQLERELERKQSQCDELQQSLTTANQRLQDAEEKNVQLVTQNESLQMTVEQDLKGDDEEEVESRLREQSELLNRDALQMEVTELQNRLRDAEEQLRLANTAHTTEMTLENISVQQLEANVYQSEQLIKQLEKELEKKQEECEINERELALLRSKVATYEQGDQRDAAIPSHGQSPAEHLAQGGPYVAPDQPMGAVALVGGGQELQAHIPQPQPLDLGLQNLDLAESNQPPPDVTNAHSSLQPDVASYFQQGNIQHPDIVMPDQQGEVGPAFGVDLVHPELNQHFQASPQLPVEQVHQAEQFVPQQAVAPEGEQAPLEQPQEADGGRLAELENQLATFQQAISDWQVWGDNQSRELAAAHENLQLYSDSLSAAQAELETLRQQVQHGEKPSSSADADGLQARLKAKEHEVADLTETLDRLQSEKSDLEAEVSTLTKSNQDLQMYSESRAIDSNVFEETKRDLDELAEENRRLEKALISSKEQMDLIKTNHDNQLQEVQTRLSQQVEDVRQRSAQLEAECDALKTELEQRKQASEELQQALSNKEKEAQELLERLEQLQATGGSTQELAEYQQAIADWQAWAASQGEEMMQLHQRIKELEEEKALTPGSNDDMDEIARIKTEMEGKVAMLEEKASQLENVRVELQTKLASSEEELNALRNKVIDLEKQVSVLSDEKEQLQESLQSSDASKDEKLSEYEQAIADWQIWAASQGEEVARLQGQISALEEEKTALENIKASEDMAQDKSDMETKITDLQVTTAQMEAKIVDLEKVKVKMQEKLTSTEENLNVQMARVLELEEELSVTKTDKENLQRTLDTSVGNNSEKLTEYEQAITDWQAWAQSQGDEMARLQQHINALEEEKEKLLKTKETLDKMGETKTDLEGKLAQMEEQIFGVEKIKTDLESQLANTDKELATQKSKVLELEEIVSTLRKEKEELQETMKSAGNNDEKLMEYEQAIADWQKWASTQNEETTRLQQELEEALKEKSSLTTRLAQLEELRSESTALSTKMEAAEADLEALRQSEAQLKLKVADVETAKVNLEQQLNAAQERQLRTEEETGRLEMQINELTKEKSSLQGELVELKSKLESVDAASGAASNEDLEQYKAAIAQWQEWGEHQTQELTKLQTEHEELVQSKEATEKEAKEREEELGRLQVRLDIMKNSFGEMERKAGVLKNENGELNERLDNALAEKEILQNVEVDNERLKAELVRLKADLELQTSGVHDESRISEQEENLASEVTRLRVDLNQSEMERRNLSGQVQRWKRHLASQTEGGLDVVEEADLDEEDDEVLESPVVLRAKQKQAWRSVGAMKLRVEELTLEVAKLLEERDTLQLKLSNVMRQYERQKESSSRASTARNTPVPWVDNTIEIKELRAKIEELSRLNYTKDVELQKQRQQMEVMQVRIRHHSTASSRESPSRNTQSPSVADSRPSPVQHL